MDAMILKTSELAPNDYNPNHMTDEEFAELVTEVEHLGRIPKPIIVRSNGDGYVIVDGEHGWRAAKEVGLESIPCEVVEVDDFEAMRQTYKRNQHGTHNPVRLGEMFEAMMAERDMSQRELAEEMDVSEGTIRNALEYVKARNGYAEWSVESIESLGVREVRLLNRLPKRVAEVWFACGADVRALFGSVGEPGTSEWLEKSKVEWYEKYEDIFMLGTNAEKMSYAREEPATFLYLRRAAQRKLADANRFRRGGLEADDLIPFLKRYWARDFFVQDEYFLMEALAIVIDANDYPAKLVVSPDDWERAFEEQRKLGGSLVDFRDRLKRLAFDKSQHRSDLRGSQIANAMKDLEMKENAPEYIRDSKLPVLERHELWQAKGHEPTKVDLAAMERLPVDWRWQLKTGEESARLAALDVAELAEQLVPLLVPESDGEDERLQNDKAKAREILGSLPKPMLCRLYDAIYNTQLFKAMATIASQ